MSEGLLTSGSGDYYRPANGQYLGEFIGLRKGPVLPTQKTHDDGTVETVMQQKILWQFNLSDAVTGQQVIDPKKNAQAVGEGMTNTTIGMGRGNEATARKYLRALEASAGRVLSDSVTEDEANQLIQAHAAARTRVMLEFAHRGSKDGVLVGVNPIYQPPTAAPAPAPAPTPPAPAPVGATAEIPPANYDEVPVVAVSQ